MPDADDFEATREQPSKTALKRQMTALQELGETLAQLPEKQLAKIPIEDERLLEAIREVRRIRSNSARRRHLQYIGKLMRNIDPEPMRAALEALRLEHQRATGAFHQLEHLRQEVLDAGPGGAELVMRRWPRADRQMLRRLLLQHQREVKQGAPPAASRKLFKYLRELQEQA